MKKKEEYREIKPYWTIRILHELGYTRKDMDYILECMKKTSFVFEGYVLLQNGYGVNAPKAVAFCAASIGTGKEKWGAVPGKEYYVFEIMDIKEVRKND